jgi:hypothetical protein
MNESSDLLIQLSVTIGSIFTALIGALATVLVAYINSNNKKMRRLQNEDRVQSINNSKRINEEFEEYRHARALKVIEDIIDQCNYVKDTTRCDTAAYFVLENSTIAIDKLENIYISCRATDNRYSLLNNHIAEFQKRIVSQSIVDLAKLKECIILLEPDAQSTTGSINEYPEIQSYGAISIRDYNNNNRFIGFAILLFTMKNFNDTSPSNMELSLYKFKNSIEAILRLHKDEKDAKLKSLIEQSYKR